MKMARSFVMMFSKKLNKYPVLLRNEAHCDSKQQRKEEYAITDLPKKCERMQKKERP